MTENSPETPWPIRSDQKPEVVQDLNEACEIIRSLAGPLTVQRTHPDLRILDADTWLRLENWADKDEATISLSEHLLRVSRERYMSLTDEDLAEVVACAMRGIDCCRPQPPEEDAGAI